jgi:SAM-dependent methyltransferase
MSGPNQSERTRDFFDETAGGWSSRYDRDPNMASRRRRFSEALRSRLAAPADVLDFGCGSGDLGLHLAGCGYRLTGCDLSAAMIEQARAADLAHSAKWVALEKVPPASPLPFDDSSFDAVISSSVLEYVGTVDDTLGEINRILRPGGWILATVPDMRSPSRQRELWLRRAAIIPLLATVLDHSRWREGARYQRISINRWPGARWHTALQAADFQVDPLPECTGPLVLLSGRRLSNKS